jgi:hypothetical protein
MTSECNRCKELSGLVDEVLDKLVALTNEQLEVFRRHNMTAFMHLDKELELTIGKKERSVGALREHRREHEGDVNAKAG